VKRAKLAVALSCILTLLAIALVPWAAGAEYRSAFFYLIPIIVAGWWAGRSYSLVCALVATIVSFTNNVTLREEEGLALIWNQFTRATTFFAAAILSDNLRRARDRLRSEKDFAFTLAIRDPLTGLYNRFFMQEQLDLLHAAANRHHRAYCVIALDLDGVKELNDRFGHQAGDHALANFALDLRECIRKEDIPVRLGGDEFIVLLADTDVEDAAATAGRIVDHVRERSATAGRVAGVSAGVAMWQPGREPDQVLAVADRLLYTSKRDGGQSVTVEPRALGRLGFV
jgi:diguanylate cyclase (GGDEF)-like protein